MRESQADPRPPSPLPPLQQTWPELHAIWLQDCGRNNYGHDTRRSSSEKFQRNRCRNDIDTTLIFSFRHLFDIVSMAHWGVASTTSRLLQRTHGETSPNRHELIRSGPGKLLRTGSCQSSDFFLPWCSSWYCARRGGPGRAGAGLEDGLGAGRAAKGDGLCLDARERPSLSL